MQNEKESKRLVGGEGAMKFNGPLLQDLMKNCYIPYPENPFPPYVNHPYDTRIQKIIEESREQPVQWLPTREVQTGNTKADLLLAFIAGILYSEVTITEDLRKLILTRIDDVINK